MSDEKKTKNGFTSETASEAGKLSFMKFQARRDSGRLMSDTLKMLEGQKEYNKNRIKKLQAYGVDPDNFTNMASGLLAVHERMLAGDIKAAEFIRDTMGEKPVEKQQVQATVSKWFKDDSEEE